MRSMWKLPLVTVVMLGTVGCGPSEVEAPEQHAPGGVHQQGRWLGCEVTEAGIQTGRCVDLNGCSIIGSMYCEAGISGGRYFPNCGGHTNYGPCSDL